MCGAEKIVLITRKFLEHKLWSVHFWLFWPRIPGLDPYRGPGEGTLEKEDHQTGPHLPSWVTLELLRTLCFAPLSSIVHLKLHSLQQGRELCHLHTYCTSKKQERREKNTIREIILIALSFQTQLNTDWEMSFILHMHVLHQWSTDATLKGFSG